MRNIEFDYRQGFVNYPGGRSGSAGDKAPYVDHGTRPIDPARYYSREQMQLEWQHCWTKVWTFAGLAQDVPNVGDYLRYNLGRASFLIVRESPGPTGISAYHNVCPHRGNRIVHNDFGHTGGCRFTCDFHGWQFGLDGANRKIRDELIFRPEVIADRPGLTRVKCEVWNSLIFINPDPDPAQGLIEYLDVIPRHLAPYDFSKLRVLRDIEYVWDANWKTAFDAFIEFYHADDVHPEAVPVMETLECQYDLYPNGISRMILPMGFVTSRYEDRDTVNESLRLFIQAYGGNPEDYRHLKGHEYKQAFVAVKRAWGRRHGYAFFDDLTDDQMVDDWSYSTFNMTLNVFADTVLVQNFRPHPTEPGKSYYSAITLCLPVSDDVTRVMDVNSFGPEAFSPPGWKGEERAARFVPKELAEFGYLLAQDARRVPEVQRGIESGYFKGARLSESECRIRHYNAEIDRLIASAR